MMKILYWSIPLALFIWSFFDPPLAAYALIACAVLFEGFLFILDLFGRRKTREAGWTSEEIGVIKRYHISLHNSFRAKKYSGLLNGFRLSIIFWVPWLLWNELWIPVGLMTINFFITASLSVKLDPLFYLAGAVRKGQRQFETELATLRSVIKKLKNEKGIYVKG